MYSVVNVYVKKHVEYELKVASPVIDYYKWSSALNTLERGRDEGMLVRMG